MTDDTSSDGDQTPDDGDDEPNDLGIPTPGGAFDFPLPPDIRNALDRLSARHAEQFRSILEQMNVDMPGMDALRRIAEKQNEDIARIFRDTDALRSIVDSIPDISMPQIPDLPDTSDLVTGQPTAEPQLGHIVPNPALRNRELLEQVIDMLQQQQATLDEIKDRLG